MTAMARQAVWAGKHAAKAVAPVVAASAKKRAPPPGSGDWIAGVAMSTAGARRFRLYKPPGIQFGERLPLLVMLHGCGQDAKSFALSTRMNRIAAAGRFLVLYPEQDRMANPQGCWNWFDTTSGRAYGEAALIMKAIDQVCWLYAADRDRVAIAGLSAGASMAALLVTRHPERFKALAMHSGVPPGTARSSLSAFGAMRGHQPTRALEATPMAMAAHWPPLLVIHGNGDSVVASHNGKAAVEAWATAAGAQACPVRNRQRGKRHASTVTDYKRSGAMVAQLVEIDQLGHAWSGGAANQAFSDAAGPDASRLVWAFAAKHIARG